MKDSSQTVSALNMDKSSGVCTIGQIITATWAYAFTGISIVFAAILMKAGVLIAAPIVDLIIKTRKRTIYLTSLLLARTKSPA